MVLGMLPAGLRRCEVLGLRFDAAGSALRQFARWMVAEAGLTPHQAADSGSGHMCWHRP